jgi:hypothetical protein
VLTATEVTAKADKAIPKLRCSILMRSLAARMLDLAGGVEDSQES